MLQSVGAFASHEKVRGSNPDLARPKLLKVTVLTARRQVRVSRGVLGDDHTCINGCPCSVTVGMARLKTLSANGPWVQLKICSPSPVMVKSPFKLNIFESMKNAKQTNIFQFNNCMTVCYVNVEDADSTKDMYHRNITKYSIFSWQYIMHWSGKVVLYCQGKIRLCDFSKPSVTSDVLCDVIFRRAD